MSGAVMKIVRQTGGAPLRVVVTPGRSSITPASLLCLVTIDRHPDLIRGQGIDWGTGSGVLAIAAATQPGVDLVVGLELEFDEVMTARTNAELNGVADRVAFLVADSFQPVAGEDTAVLESLRGSADFLIANPPTSAGDDGLGWRRRVLLDGLEFLRPGANVLLQVSRQYGQMRTEQLAGNDFDYRGLLETSDWVPFDQRRPDLREALDWYVTQEQRTGLVYPFLHPSEDREIDATEAQHLRDRNGVSPRSQWRTHHLVRR